MIRSNKIGQGLMSAVAAMLLMGVCAIGLQNMLSTAQINQNMMANMGDKTALKLQLISFLSSHDRCAGALQDSSGQPAKFNPSNPSDAATNSVAQVKIGSTILAGAGMGSGRFQIEDVSLVPDSAFTPEDSTFSEILQNGTWDNW